MATASALETIVGRMHAPEAAAYRNQHAWPVVLDASAIIDDIPYRTGPRSPTSALTVAMLVGVIRPVGKTDVLEEVARNLPEVAKREDRDLADSEPLQV